MQKEINELKSKVSKSEESISIKSGDKATLEYSLKIIDTKKDFDLTYEVEILEVSIDKVRVNALDFTSFDTFAKDPKNKTEIINFMQNKWIPKSNVNLIIDDSIRRNDKIEKILN